MTIRDLFRLSLSNLFRRKLRAFLTISGVVIAIGAFVAMLSFGAGNRRNFTEQFEELDLFFTLQVYADNHENRAPGGERAILDRKALDRLASIKGVRLIYPFDSFPVEMAIADTQFSVHAQALPGLAAETRLFSRLIAGKMLQPGDRSSLLVGERFVRKLPQSDPDSIVGTSVILTARVASVDSGLVRFFRSEAANPSRFVDAVDFDSLPDQEYRRRLLRSETRTALEPFVEGLMEGTVLRETLTVVGVLRTTQERAIQMEPLLVSEETARRFRTGGIPTEPTALLGAIQSGRLFADPGAVDEGGAETFPKATIHLERDVTAAAISDSVEALGYRTFNFAEHFDEVRRFMLYFDIALGVVAMIALITAALGITNTMIMSISERRREIGIMKSLGADDADIRLLFLFESGMIGSVGGLFGILLGWIVARAASFAGKVYMVREGMTPMDPFATPLWLMVLAFFFGLVVSVIAGALPSSRAARVDPVIALRQ